ncbi:uncharacterized protein PHACADRAFT_255268 [Phanerochaete carnosa HHB-10118-sp]|uniref:Uncharacterized protein n=1 Tax=Phanerochaete carnosa (strain HHB-10118-sp) TaxID=650164 RepID=K5WWZ0_PHACS|nr:uncharacterized protein PHACADRAFT_255268 [Phanerochaete carnosa HHB-10118-sp]EKM54992.1 hypothetical protein PHACADRAFT_255268 [Phanerochaete carnosa HHB-10118-sp]
MPPLAICDSERPSRDTGSYALPEPLWVLLTRYWQDKARDRPSSSELYQELRHISSPRAPKDVASDNQPESDGGTLSTRTVPKSRCTAQSTTSVWRFTHCTRHEARTSAWRLCQAQHRRRSATWQAPTLTPRSADDISAPATPSTDRQERITRHILRF